MSRSHQQTPSGSELPEYLISEIGSTAEGQSHAEAVFKQLYDEWYFLEHKARCCLAGKIVEAAFPASPASDLDMERNRLMTGRYVAEDDDPEDNQRARKSKPADGAWYPGSEALAARRARERSASRAARSSRTIGIIPSIEVVDVDEVNSDRNTKILHTERILFQLPTPEPTPEPASPSTERARELLSKANTLLANLEGTIQTLEAKLAKPGVQALEAERINVELRSVKKRVGELGDFLEKGLDRDAELLHEHERSAGRT